MTGPALTAVAPEGVPEVRAGDDLAALLLDRVDLEDGDVVLVTSKVVAKAEGRVVPGTREDALDGETDRLVARRGPTRIVRTHHGLTLAAAGIDASNVEQGHVVLLPRDPDASAARLRQAIHERTGRSVAVLVTDTAGRAWRQGQTDIAVGSSGLRVLDDHAGRHDAHGNELLVTAPAVADELACVAELVAGKLGGRPFVIVRGRADLVLGPDDDGPGARALVRPEAEDMFGLGAREAVVRALTGGSDAARGFGRPAPAADLAAALTEVLGPSGVAVVADDHVTCPRDRTDAVAALARAHGWLVETGTGGPDRQTGTDASLRPGSP
ncbi:coenzyme F420-0:L-glutamate ligase [Nocardioides taihuensis]|uniref:Coenzyme F420-0:L-glutamate ligase n=1 Tax=Nocardioides taihuensis TaxID=1835606 RepID=A0ABW0BNF0_9ACTN